MNIGQNAGNSNRASAIPLFPKFDDKQLLNQQHQPILPHPHTTQTPSSQQHPMYFYPNGMIYYNYDPSLGRIGDSCQEYLHMTEISQQQLEQQAFHYNQSYLQNSYNAYAPNGQRILLPSQSTQPPSHTLLNYNEMDYFDQFLGNQAEGRSNSSESIPVNGINAKCNDENIMKKRKGSNCQKEEIEDKQKSNKPLLDVDTKRAHHIASEHKRRGRIRSELQRIAELIPELAESPRNSQSKILSAAADYIETVVSENMRLRADLQELQGKS